MSRDELVLAGTAAAALALGVGVYLLDRDWSSALFLSAFAAHQATRLAVFGAAGLWLPSLLHAYAFCALIAAALWPWPRSRASVCLGWFSVAAALEMTYGRFDPSDLVATAAGCLLAYITTIVLRNPSCLLPDMSH
jgi:hypothetical protein